MLVLDLGIWLGYKAAGDHSSERISKLEKLFSLISDEYVDKIDMDSLVEKSIPDILAYLDPHTVYIPASELETMNNELEGSFSGIGVKFQLVNDTVVVAETIIDGPAEKVGIKAGDRILEADKIKLYGPEITQEKVFKMLRGEKYSMVNLKIKRPGVKGTTEYKVRRMEVPVKSVDTYFMLEDGVGYVQVSQFGRNTYEEFMVALADLKSQGARKMVIDLRGNTGGFIEPSILMANEFLPAGRGIVYTRGRNKENELHADSDGGGQYQDMEITVLMDEYSASASEMFAGAIQDNDRGLIIGRRSFGKGLVQNQITLPDNSAIRLTVARYYTPSGRSIQKIYTPGAGGKYEMDILERFTHGELYSADSIKIDKSKKYKTVNGRTVYGGGGIIPDIFVGADTTGFTSYYVNVMNKGLVHRYAMNVADNYRNYITGSKSIDKVLKMIPRDQMLLNNFVQFAASQGVPARWYYINRSRGLLLSQIKANIVRDLLGYNAYIEMTSKDDKMLKCAVNKLKSGKSPTSIKK